MKNFTSLFTLAICACLLSFQSCVDQVAATPTKATAKMVKSNTWESIEQAAINAKKDRKKIIVDVYTDWCKWCKVMDEKTFKNETVIQYLDQNFHRAKFNAEDKSTITFNGKNYDWTANGRKGYNELTPELLDGKLAYPSIVVFDADLNKLQVIRGYKSPEQLMTLLKADQKI